jgi:uncharacterized protein YukE
MSEVIKMDYPAMEEMANAFKQGTQTLEDCMNEMEAAAASMEGGALLGRGGDGWVNAIRDRLIRVRLAKLRDKFNELNGDVIGALVDLRDGDHESQSRFK